MPIRDDEKFCTHFLGDTKEESEGLLRAYDNDLTMLSNRCAMHTGLDKNDLKQEATIGLARARRDFEPNRSENFRIFAIYKIKDALREYVTMQGSNVRLPQYIKDAARLVGTLKKVMCKGVVLHPYASFTDIWEIACSSEVDKDIAEEINGIKTSIENLSSRSHTTITQLLERAEMSPFLNESSIDITYIDTIDGLSDDHKIDIIDSLYNRKMASELKDVLSEEDYALLYKRFVEEYTIRELAPKLGISPESIVVKTNKILKKLKQSKFGQKYENNKDTKETG